MPSIYHHHGVKTVLKQELTKVLLDEGLHPNQKAYQVWTTKWIKHYDRIKKVTSIEQAERLKETYELDEMLYADKKNRIAETFAHVCVKACEIWHQRLSKPKKNRNSTMQEVVSMTTCIKSGVAPAGTEGHAFGWYLKRGRGGKLFKYDGTEWILSNFEDRDVRWVK